MKYSNYNDVQLHTLLSKYALRGQCVYYVASFTAALAPCETSISMTVHHETHTPNKYKINKKPVSVIVQYVIKYRYLFL